MSNPIIFDVETQKTFQEVGGRVDKLGVSVVGVYDYANDKYLYFLEKDLNKLFKLFEQASYLIGYNNKKFDIEVLKPYYVGDISKFQHLDILEEIQKSLGHRIALDDVVKGTLEKRKEGHGLQAINLYNEGKIKELIDYCLSDVRLTKEVYEYARVYKKLYYLGPSGKIEIKMILPEIISYSEINLTLPI